jgi:hypothetical protein
MQFDGGASAPPFPFVGNVQTGSIGRLAKMTAPFSAHSAEIWHTRP